MSSMNVYSYTNDDLNRLANQTKEALIAYLANEGHLDLPNQKEYEDFCASHVVFLARKGMFGRFWDKLRGLTEPNNDYIVTVLHSKLPHPGKGADVISLVRDEEDEE
jgi:hypothetical protein